MQDHAKDIINFFKKEVLIKDFLAPLRILALLYMIIGFYFPIGWIFVKTTILLFLSSFYSGPILHGVNWLSIFALWWLYVIDIVIVTFLVYSFILTLNKKGAKFFLTLLPILGFVTVMFLFVIAINIIDSISFINLISAMTIADNFLF